MPLATFSCAREAGYENCPLKKRPFRFVYHDDDPVEPENLSMKKFRDDSDEENYAVHAQDLRVRVKRETEVVPAVQKCPQQSPFERTYEHPLPAPSPVVYSSVRLSPPPSPPTAAHHFQRVYHPLPYAPVQNLQPLMPVPRRVEGRHLGEVERNAYFRHPAFDWHKPTFEHNVGFKEVPEVRAVISGHHDHAQGHYVKAPVESCMPPSFVSPGRPESAFTPFSPASTASYISSESADELEVGVEGQTVLPDNSGSAPRYTCDACSKSYSTLNGLSKHKQYHCVHSSSSPGLEGVKIDTVLAQGQEIKNFSCKFCDKAYVSLGALKMHIRTHTLPCKCHLCGKAFSRPWLLQGHLRTHTGEKPFSCGQCGRSFADRSNLRAHMQTHEEVKKYSCDHCGKTFSRMSLLNKHLDNGCHVKQEQ